MGACRREQRSCRKGREVRMRCERGRGMERRWDGSTSAVPSIGRSPGSLIRKETRRQRRLRRKPKTREVLTHRRVVELRLGTQARRTLAVPPTEVLIRLR